MNSFESSGADRKQTLKTSISFSSELFEMHSRDGGHFGRDLALWLVERSQGSVFAFGVPEQNDIGWTIPVTATGETFLLGIDDSSLGDSEAEWAITVQKKQRWKIFGQANSAMRAELCDLIQNILREEPRIGEIRWSS